MAEVGGEAQRLFLLEFLVEEVEICKTKSMIRRVGDDQKWLDGQTCVNFQFLAFPFLEICEKDFTPCRSSDSTTEFRIGKSCMFALSPELMNRCQADFPIHVAIYRKMAEGVKPDVYLLGECEIPLQEHFGELVTKACGCQEEVETIKCASKTIKDTFPVKTPGSCKQIGDISVFVRLTCFGKVIVTQFQMNSAKKEYLFKGSDDEAVFQCKQLEMGTKDCGCTGLVDPADVVPPPPTMCARASQRPGTASSDQQPSSWGGANGSPSPWDMMGGGMGGPAPWNMMGGPNAYGMMGGGMGGANPYGMGGGMGRPNPMAMNGAGMGGGMGGPNPSAMNGAGVGGFSPFAMIGGGMTGPNPWGAMGGGMGRPNPQSMTGAMTRPNTPRMGGGMGDPNPYGTAGDVTMTGGPVPCGSVCRNTGGRTRGSGGGSR